MQILTQLLVNKIKKNKEMKIQRKLCGQTEKEKINKLNFVVVNTTLVML